MQFARCRGGQLPSSETSDNGSDPLVCLSCAWHRTPSTPHPSLPLQAIFKFLPFGLTSPMPWYKFEHCSNLCLAVTTPRDCSCSWDAPATHPFPWDCQLLLLSLPLPPRFEGVAQSYCAGSIPPGDSRCTREIYRGLELHALQ